MLKKIICIIFAALHLLECTPSQPSTYTHQANVHIEHKKNFTTFIKISDTYCQAQKEDDETQFYIDVIKQLYQIGCKLAMQQDVSDTTFNIIFFALHEATITNSIDPNIKHHGEIILGDLDSLLVSFLPKLFQNSYSPLLLDYMLKRPAVGDYMQSLLTKDSIAHINSPTLHYLVSRGQLSVSILEELYTSQEETSSNLQSLMHKAIFPKEHQTTLSTADLSLSERHLLQLAQAGKASMLYAFTEPHLADCASRVMQVQKELEEQGYYCFIHAQKLCYRPAERWFTFLWELQNGIPCTDFLFMHVTDSAAKKPSLIDGEWRTNPHNHPLFLNPTLFAHDDDYFGSCSASLFLIDHNWSHLEVTTKDAFMCRNLSMLYLQFQKELEELDRLHEKLSQQGTLLVIAIPPSLAPACIYPSDLSGFRTTVTITNADGTKTTTEEIHTIREALHRNPMSIEDGMPTFCLIMDDHFGLNPQSGIIIKDFINASPQKINEYEKKESALRAKISEAYHTSPSIN